MRLSISSLSYRVVQNRSASVSSKSSMSSTSSYSVELPYLGAILLGKSPLNLTSFQKPLRELYIPYYHEPSHDQRRLIISDCDLLIFEPAAIVKGKRSFIYSKLEGIVDVQTLKLSMMINDTENQHYKRMQAAFLPIGCEHQERFRSLYSTIGRTQYNLLSTSTASHPSLLLFVLRKPGAGGSSSLLDCHVFLVHREIAAFEVCEMIRKLISRRTSSPVLPRRIGLVRTLDYPTDNVNINDVVHSSTNTPRNPSCSLSSLLINNVQHSPVLAHDTSKVLTSNTPIHRMSSPCSASKQRHFIKASTSNQEESEQIVNDLMNIVATETLKNQVSIKRHASFDQISQLTDQTMNKKRYFHNKKRLINPVPTVISTPHQSKPKAMIDGQLLRPQIVINRYGDIGNYVPKFLRENVTTRLSDSNENIFFRSSNGQLLNGFLQMDILSAKPIQGSAHHYQSSPCLNQDENIYSLVQQLRKTQAKSYININQNDLNTPNRVVDMDTNPNNENSQVSHPLKSREDLMNDVQPPRRPCKSNISSLPSKTKRGSSLTRADVELPVDYRQYLRHTDQGAYLYGEKQQRTSLEHSLGYFP